MLVWPLQELLISFDHVVDVGLAQRYHKPVILHQILQHLLALRGGSSDFVQLPLALLL